MTAVDAAEAKGDFRERLWDSLGSGPFLARREVLEVEGDVRVHCELYRHAPDAPVVLFLPGLGTYVELYAELLADLCSRGFNVVGVDPRGHGFSGGDRGYYRVEELVSDLQLVLDRLQLEFDGPVAAFGYSGGAISALALAERDARIGAVVCGTLLLSELEPDWMHGIGWHWTRTSAWFFPRLKLPLQQFVDFEALLDGHPAGPLISKDPRMVFEYPLGTLASLFSQRSRILSQPCDFQLAILQGERDEVLDAKYARRVVASAKQPVELILIPGEGHMLPWDNPAAMADHAGNWLRRVLMP
ncbi:MAG: alpha/beta fold hydrolase [Oceanospirillaceae bacterium]|nr:alpha/beta fold hydrolase [Oceanospirillaceae bacterium]